MLSLKIFLLSIGRQGFHHGFRGRLNTIARRGVTTSQRNHRNGDRWFADEQALDDMGQGDLGLADGASDVSSLTQGFHELDKDVAILKVQMCNIETNFANLGRRFDKGLRDANKIIDMKYHRLLAFIIGSFLLTAGFDGAKDYFLPSTRGAKE